MTDIKDNPPPLTDEQMYEVVAPFWQGGPTSDQFMHDLTVYRAIKAAAYLGVSSRFKD